jgi:hypothetical protein
MPFVATTGFDQREKEDVDMGTRQPLGSRLMDDLGGH